MKRLLTLMLSAAVLLTASSVSAASSITSSTGMIHNPTADVLQEGSFSLGYYHLQEAGVGTLGLNLAKGLEVGVAGFRYTDGRNNENLLNVKFSLAPETVLTPGLAVGAEDLTNSGRRSAYAVASKSLPFGFRIHAGVGNGRFDGVFAGLEKTFNPLGLITGSNAFPATTLVVEYDGRKMNYGAKLAIVPGLKLDAGLRDHHFYTGITFIR